MAIPLPNLDAAIRSEPSSPSLWLPAATWNLIAYSHSHAKTQPKYDNSESRVFSYPPVLLQKEVF
ncbi:unnamed protein product [Fusarium graminearum]|uniref:Chromosome 1, complete genome n=1 Tax=Gibberella zeae (strain ATCC MYA-4620 / CBS 123657 / FGSC 9075 / NRRL 31084 / PH-1) TaxID=229533 RepID=A0A098D7M5_GIBZE|nr:unnamed protein product [Fusarium graminearum]